MVGARAQTRLATKYPPPGQMVDVGGYRLHIHCQRGHTPGSLTVVRVGGNGKPGLTWAAFQPEVARFARVCTPVGVMVKQRPVEGSLDSFRRPGG